MRARILVILGTVGCTPGAPPSEPVVTASPAPPVNLAESSPASGKPADHGVGEAARGAKEPAESPAPAISEPPPLPAGTTVLHVGDSMADALGKDLRRELLALGLKAPLKYQEATYIPQWAGFSMGFDGLIAQHDPDLVIITLGGNETAMPDPTERADAVKRLVTKVGDRPCLWVAAPLWPGAPNTGILDVIRDNCAPCLYVDTNALVKPPMAVLGDGVHPTLPERKRWAKFMIRFLRHNRTPDGPRPWDFKNPLEAPPPAPDEP
jgi:hypothetical protein